MDKHIFSFYYLGLKKNTLSIGEQLHITDAELINRMSKILRLQIDEHCILFNESTHVLVKITSTNTVSIIEVNKNKILFPYIILLLPVLKRAALQEAMSNAVQVGANEIQLVITRKVQRKWGGEKELARLKKIIIASAEQSKNYSFPNLLSPVQFEDVLKKHQCDPTTVKKIYGSPTGTSIKSQILSWQQFPEKLILLVGPEGGLTHDEDIQLQKNNFIGCTLTPTILRSVQAATLLVGIYRSLSYS